MKIVNCLKQLVDEVLNAISVETIWLLFQYLKEIPIHELKD